MAILSGDLTRDHVSKFSDNGYPITVILVMNLSFVGAESQWGRWKVQFQFKTLSFLKPSPTGKDADEFNRSSKYDVDPPSPPLCLWVPVYCLLASRCEWHKTPGKSLKKFLDLGWPLKYISDTAMLSTFMRKFLVMSFSVEAQLTKCTKVRTGIAG